MSRVRLVINAVVVVGRTHAEVAAQYGLSRSWVTRLVARYRLAWIHRCGEVVGVGASTRKAS